MTGMVTYAGLDVHARSTHAAAIDVETGELVRARFGPGTEEPVAWLQNLPGPARACYEAGPTGFGLYRAASAAGLDVRVIAPGKTPRGPSAMATTKKRTTAAAKPVTRAKPVTGSNGSAASNGYSTATKPGRIRSKARREAIEAFRERTSKPLGLSPEVAATLKDDAWGKRLVDP